MSDTPNANRSPSMRDVAKSAGVSQKTVSRVVNGETYVNTETAKRVQDAITTLGFRPNEIARNLRQGQKTATIGLIIEDIANPFYSQVARGVESIARREGSLIITGSSEEDPTLEQELVQTLLRRRVDGLILVPSRGDHTYLKTTLQGIPIVCIDRPANHFSSDTILLENRNGSERGVQYLIRSGHNRIAYIGGYPTVFTGQERFAGYRQALEVAGLTFEPTLVRHDCHDIEHAEAAMLELLALPKPPTAVFCSSNRTTLGVIHALYTHKTQIEIVGFDEVELADLLPFPFMMLRHDPVELGRRAAQLLFQRLRGQTSPLELAIVPVELVASNRALVKRDQVEHDQIKKSTSVRKRPTTLR